jgi:hypothetical protein
MLMFIKFVLYANTCNQMLGDRTNFNHFRHEYLLEGVFVQILYILVSSRLHIYIKMMDKNILTMPSERSVCWRVPDGQ